MDKTNKKINKDTLYKLIKFISIINIKCSNIPEFITMIKDSINILYLLLHKNIEYNKCFFNVINKLIIPLVWVIQDCQKKVNLLETDQIEQ